MLACALPDEGFIYPFIFEQMFSKTHTDGRFMRSKHLALCSSDTLSKYACTTCIVLYIHQ